MAVSFPLQPEIYLPLASFQWVSCLPGNQVEMFNNSYIGKCSVTTIYSYSKHHQPRSLGTACPIVSQLAPRHDVVWRSGPAAWSFLCCSNTNIMFPRTGMGPTAALPPAHTMACAPCPQRERMPPGTVGRGISIFLSPNQGRWGVLGLQKASPWEQFELTVLRPEQGLRGGDLTLHMEVTVSPEP